MKRIEDTCHSLNGTSRPQHVQSIQIAQAPLDFARARNRTISRLASTLSRATAANCGKNESRPCDMHACHPDRPHPKPRTPHAHQHTSRDQHQAQPTCRLQICIPETARPTRQPRLRRLLALPPQTRTRTQPPSPLPAEIPGSCPTIPVPSIIWTRFQTAQAPIETDARQVWPGRLRTCRAALAMSSANDACADAVAGPGASRTSHRIRPVRSMTKT